MTNAKSTKRALLFSVLSLFVCVTMLIGSTFAWFTDKATTGVNTITSGNLNVELQYSKDMSTWANAEGATEVFSANKWEPGYTEVVYFQVKNAGSLAFDYQVATNIVKETAGKNQEGREFKLSDYLQFGIVETTAKFTNRDAARAAITVPNKFSNISAGESTLEQGATKVFAMVVWMPEGTDNEANHNGVNVPEIQFGVNVIASQAMVETDSFGTDYDKNATYPESPKLDAIVAAPGTLEELNTVLQEAFTGGSAGTITINLTKDFDAENNWTPVTPKGYAGVNNVVINGNGHTIKNLNKPLVVGTFAGAGSITINGLTLKDVNIEDSSYNDLGLAAFIAYADATATATFNDCHLVDANIKGAVSTGEDPSSRVAGFIGYTSGTAITLDGCTISGTTIIESAEDVAALVGYTSATTTIINCKVENATVKSSATDKCRSGALVANLNCASATFTNNTVTDVTVEQTWSGSSTRAHEYYGRVGASTAVTIN